jgi:DNA-binding transcriptional MocR family regulator
MLPQWRTRVYQEQLAGNLTLPWRVVLFELDSYFNAGGLAWPSHATLAGRVGCCTKTVGRALEAARALGLLEWSRRRVRIGWRSLQSSNLYRRLMPEKASVSTDRPWVRRVRSEVKKVRKAAQEMVVALTNRVAWSDEREDQWARENRDRLLRVLREDEIGA